jgi:WD40 repeat protein
LPLLAVAFLPAELPARPAAPPTLSADPLPPGARLRISSPRFSHGGPVRALAFGPGGRWLASGSDDHTISLWDVPSGRERLRLHCTARVVSVSVSVSHDGRLLASGQADGTVRLWTLEGPRTGQESCCYSNPAEGAPLAAFAPTGSRLAIIDGRFLLLYDTAGRKEIWKTRASSALRALVWAPDGRSVATAAPDAGVCLWRADNGSPLCSCEEGFPSCLAFSADGRQLAGWEDSGRLFVWEPPSAKVVLRWETEPGRGRHPGVLRFSPDGRTLLLGTDRGLVERWKPTTWEKTEWEGHSGVVSALAVSPDGRRLASAGDDHMIRLWDLGTQRLVERAGPDGPIRSASLSADGKTLATVTAAGTLDLWRLPEGKRLPLPEGLRDRFQAVAFRPDGKSLGVITAPPTRELRLYDVETGKLTARGDPRPVADNLAFSPDGATLATTAEREGELAFRNSGTGRVVALGPRLRLRGAVISPDGESVVGLWSPADISLWDLSGNLRLTLPGHSGGMLAVCFSPDGRLLVSGGKDETVRVWELTSAAQRLAINKVSGSVGALALTPDGRTLATGTFTGVIHLIDLLTGEELRRLEGHRGPITSLNFTDAGRTLVSTGADATVLIWDVREIGRVEVVKKLEREHREVAWEILTSANAWAAGEAIRQLSADPDGTVGFLRDQVQAVDGKKVTALLIDLDDDSYQKREQATRELMRFGTALESVLERELKKKPPLEKYRRIEQVLHRIRRGPTGDALRALRAVEILERIGTREARAVLERLAGGLPDADLTRHAQGSLRRLTGSAR